MNIYTIQKRLDEEFGLEHIPFVTDEELMTVPADSKNVWGCGMPFPHTEDSKIQMSISQKERFRKNPRTKEQCEVHNALLRGKRHSEETKKQMSETAKSRVYLSTTCPHCGKKGRNNMTRYHFDNCKFIV